MKQDLEVIKHEQTSIEAALGNAYAEPNAIPRQVEDMYNDCRTLIENSKHIEKDLKGVREGQSKDVAKALPPIAETLLNFEKRILVLSEHLESLGKRLLKNGEDLVHKETFSMEIKAKTDTQGKRLESIGQRLKSIGKNFGTIGDKMSSIGNRVGGDEGPRLKIYGGELKTFGEQITLKGSAVDKLGIELQKLQLNVRDTETDKDLEDIQKSLLDIVHDLESIIRVLYLFTFLFI